MAFSYVGGANNAGNGSSATITHGLTISSGNLVVAYVNRNDSIAISNDAGGSAWTEAMQETPPSGETASHALFWKIAGASEPSSYSWTLNGTDDYHVIVKVFSSSTDAVVDAAANTTKRNVSESDVVITAADGEVISDDAVSIVFGGKDRSQATINYDTATPTDYVGELGSTAGRVTASAHKIYTTGTTFSGNITLSPSAGSPAADFTYSVHISFVESTAGGTTVNLTGQSITSAQGTVTATGGAIVSLAGQSATASQGTLTVVTGGAVTVSLSGQSITSAQGVVTATGAAVVGLSGQEITPSFGTLLATGAANVTLNGQEAAFSQGVVTVTTAAAPTIVSLSGQGITSNIGTLGLQTANVILLAGQEVTMLQGSVTAGTPPVIPDVTGVTVGGRFGEGYSVTAVFGEGVTKKGRL